MILEIEVYHVAIYFWFLLIRYLHCPRIEWVGILIRTVQIYASFAFTGSFLLSVPWFKLSLQLCLIQVVRESKLKFVFKFWADQNYVFWMIWTTSHIVFLRRRKWVCDPLGFCIPRGCIMLNFTLCVGVFFTKFLVMSGSVIINFIWLFLFYVYCVGVS